MATKYDAIVIGTGQAGPPLAVRLADTGMKVTIIERKRFGGFMPYRSLMFLGTGLVGSDYLDVVIRRGHEKQVSRCLAEFFNEDASGECARSSCRAPCRRLWRDDSQLDRR